eukprot:TRINITY_DN2914_c5_g1_i1.p1 TRINITY_DN2914_c5_g1~~TRINITY_DN2914_c5_g1_i1.p1  ORF type:complete len:726 (-),score=205.17 TRINITY_DN2914_c5_g1_i1:148-2325(-)
MAGGSADGGMVLVFALSGTLFLLAFILYICVRPSNRRTFFPRGDRNSDHDSRFRFLLYVFRSDDTEVMKRAGLVGILYMRMNLYLIIYTFVGGVLALAILLPIYVVFGQNGGSFGDVVGSDLRDSASVFWAPLVLIWVYSLMAYFLMWYYQRKVIDIKRNFINKGGPWTYTIKIKNLPRKVTEEQLSNHFESWHPGEIIAVHLAFNLNKVLELKEKRHDASLDLKRAEKMKSNGKTYPWYLFHMLQKVFCCCMKKETPDEQITRLEKRIADLTGRIETLQNDIPDTNVGTAFITFKPGPSCLKCLRDFKGRRAPKSQDPHINLHTSRWKVKQAPQPADVIWPHLRYSRTQQYLRITVTTIGVILFALLVAIPIAFLSDISGSIGLSGALAGLVEAWLPTLIAVLVQSMLPICLERFIGPWEKNHTRSSERASIMRKFYIYVIFNVLLFQLFLQGGANQIKDIFTGDKSIIDAFGDVDYEEQGAFFINYFIQLAFIGSLLQMLRLADFAERIARRWFLSITQEDRTFADVIAITIYRYYLYFAEAMLVVAILLVFSVVVPLIWPAAMLYFVIRRYIDRHAILLIAPKNHSDGRMVASVLYFFMVGMFLYHLAMIAFFIVKDVFFQMYFIIPLILLDGLFTGYLVLVGLRERRNSIDPDVIDLEQTRKFELKTSDLEDGSEDLMSRAFIHPGLTLVEDDDFEFEQLNEKKEEADDSSDDGMIPRPDV